MAASSFGKWPLVLTARLSFEFSASMVFVVYMIRRTASGKAKNGTTCSQARLLSDNGSSYVAADLADYLDAKGMDHVRGTPHHSQTQGKIPLIVSVKRLPGSGTLAPDHEEPCSAGKLLSAR